jgi:hypothetical protein
MKKLIVLFLTAIALAACGESKESGRVSALADNVYSTSNESNEVYITPYGKRYHHSWCRTIKGHSVTSLSLESAEMRGRTPCRVCY